MKSKTCFKCNQVKDISQFYKHSQMKDGYLNKCKDCAKNDIHINRKNKIEYYRNFDKMRANHPHRVQARKEYINTDKGKQAKSRACNKFRKTNPIKSKAHRAVQYALKCNKLIKPPECECCSLPNKLQAHHDDYNKPLDVKWLCSSCHSNWHKYNNPITN